MNSCDTEREGEEFLASWRAEMEAKVAEAEKRNWKSPAARSHVASARMTLELIHLELSEWDALEVVQGYLAQAEKAERSSVNSNSAKEKVRRTQGRNAPRDRWIFRAAVKMLRANPRLSAASIYSGISTRLAAEIERQADRRDARWRLIDPERIGGLIIAKKPILAGLMGVGPRAQKKA